MTDYAEYVGHYQSLKGKRARVLPDETYERPLEERTLQAQFMEAGTTHPETQHPIWIGWHTFPVTDFYLET